MEFEFISCVAFSNDLSVAASCGVVLQNVEPIVYYVSVTAFEEAMVEVQLTMKC
jgi:hypothetical protein